MEHLETAGTHGDALGSRIPFVAKNGYHNWRMTIIGSTFMLLVSLVMLVFFSIGASAYATENPPACYWDGTYITETESIGTGDNVLELFYMLCVFVVGFKRP